MSDSAAPLSLRDDIEIERLQFRPGKPTVAWHGARLLGETSCLRCSDSPCATFGESELVLESLLDFPADLTRDVCPTRALSVSPFGVPEVEADRCISCAACAARCPIGAISIDPVRGATIHASVKNSALLKVPSSKASADRTRRSLARVRREGVLALESDQSIDHTIAKIAAMRRENGDRFDGLLIRSLLAANGVRSSVARRGITHMRIEMILLLPSVPRALAAVEFGQQAALDAPRDLLDGLAVLVSRYKWELQSTVAFVFTDVLPNRRSEYWRIAHDVNVVTGVKIQTVTTSALLLSAWSMRSLLTLLPHGFYVDHLSKSYRTAVLARLLGRDLNLRLELRPEIDIAK